MITGTLALTYYRKKSAGAIGLSMRRIVRGSMGSLAFNDKLINADSTISFQ
eukprot:EC789995.1.p4 GENE.EC789995.1~~EC789995.1.p4  ORF type:complete len:51 (-),score=6.28 EC789995.1:112-264(-)